MEVACVFCLYIVFMCICVCVCVLVVSSRQTFSKPFIDHNPPQNTIFPQLNSLSLRLYWQIENRRFPSQFKPGQTYNPHSLIWLLDKT